MSVGPSVYDTDRPRKRVSVFSDSAPPRILGPSAPGVSVGSSVPVGPEGRSSGDHHVPTLLPRPLRPVPSDLAPGVRRVA